MLLDIPLLHTSNISSRNYSLLHNINFSSFFSFTMAPGATENGVEALEALVTALTAPSKESNGTENVPDVGMECDIKNLYQKEDARGRTTWTDKYPDNLDEAAENEITARFAILVRNKKSFDSRKKLEIDSIVVQSPLLKKVLSKVLKDYPGTFTHPQNLNHLTQSKVSQPT